VVGGKIIRQVNLEIVKRSDAGKFLVLPKRWIVERTIAWLNRCRRLAKDWECLNRNALGFLRWASIRLMIRRLCQTTQSSRMDSYAYQEAFPLLPPGLWLILQSDQGISSVRVAEAIRVSQPTAWRMGHALRLLVTREHQLDGTVEMNEFDIGGSPRKDADHPHLGRGRKGQPRPMKTPVLTVVQRPTQADQGAAAGDARARVVTDLSEREARRALSEKVDVAAHLMSDEWKSFVSIGQAFAAHDTVRHSDREYARGAVHANSAEGFNDRVRRTVAGVFHQIRPRHADLYFNEIGFRWSQRMMSGQSVRCTRKGREVVKPLWSRIPPAVQLLAVFKSAVGRELRRTAHGGIQIRCDVAVFG
jgi:hypothetical protein